MTNNSAQLQATELTPFQSALQSMTVGDVWARPGLSRKDRRWITLTSVAYAASPGPLEQQVYEAFSSGDISVEEMREFALHFGVYCGSPKGSYLEGVVSRQAAMFARANSLSTAPLPALPIEDLGTGDWNARLDEGAREFAEVNLIGAPVGNTPFLHVAVLGHIFGHVWQRQGLARRDRRVITLTVNGLEGTPTPVRTHVAGALKSGDLTKLEIDELVLHFTAYNGFAKGKTLNDEAEVVWAQIAAQS